MQYGSCLNLVLKRLLVVHVFLILLTIIDYKKDINKYIGHSKTNTVNTIKPTLLKDQGIHSYMYLGIDI